MSDRLNLALRSVSDSASKPSDSANDALHLIGGANGEGTVTMVKDGVATQVTGLR
jgi:Flp pilus assembly protein CpaB